MRAAKKSRSKRGRSATSRCQPRKRQVKKKKPSSSDEDFNLSSSSDSSDSVQIVEVKGGKPAVRHLEEVKPPSLDVLANERLRQEFDNYYKCSLDDIKPHILTEGSHDGIIIKTRR